MNRSYYRLLGVSHHCSQSELTKAYRALAFRFHPDRNPDGVEKFKEIARAYEVLSDTDQRHSYDAAGDDVFKNGMSPLFTAFNISRTDLDKLLNQYDNNGYNINATKSPNNLHDLFVTLEDVYCGNTVSAEVQKQLLCELCKGRGVLATSDTCDACAGSYRNKEGDPCLACQGTGLQREICTVCGGLKTKTISMTYSIQIQKGMLEGQNITLSGEGDESIGCHPGDRLFKVQYLPHSCYRRENITKLVLNVNLQLHQAIWHTGKVITLPDKRKLFFQYKPAVGKPIKNGARKFIKGEGMTDFFNPKKHGKLVVEFTILFPETISEAKLNDLRDVLGQVSMVHSCKNLVLLEALHTEDVKKVSEATFPNTVIPVLRGKCGCSSSNTGSKSDLL